MRHLNPTEDSPASEGAEHALIKAAVAGDPVALERLLLDHYEPLARRIATRLPPSLQTVVGVEDIVQQTYVQVFTGIARYEQRANASFWSWLVAIGENRIRDAIRHQNCQKRGGGRRQMPNSPPEHESGAGNLLDALAGAGHTASQSLARREGVQAIQVAVAGLSGDQRQAVELRYFQGYTLEETALLMDRSTGAVRGLLDRAKKKIRDSLERASKYLSDK